MFMIHTVWAYELAYIIICGMSEIEWEGWINCKLHLFPVQVQVIRVCGRRKTKNNVHMHIISSTIWLTLLGNMLFDSGAVSTDLGIATKLIRKLLKIDYS